MLRSSLTLLLFIALLNISVAQDYRWQQRVEYAIEAKLWRYHAQSYRHRKAGYFNNLKDTLYKIYYHLYWKRIFNPEVWWMFVHAIFRSGRLRKRPYFQAHRYRNRLSKIVSLKQDGKDVATHVDGTILEVTLKALLPQHQNGIRHEVRIAGTGADQKIRPKQPRRHRLHHDTMVPKLAEYDFQGWHQSICCPGVPWRGRLRCEAYAWIQNLWSPEPVNCRMRRRLVSDMKSRNKSWTCKTEIWPGTSKQKMLLICMGTRSGLQAWYCSGSDGPTIHPWFYQPGDKTNEAWAKLSGESVKALPVHEQILRQVSAWYIFNHPGRWWRYGVSDVYDDHWRTSGPCRLMAHEALQLVPGCNLHRMNRCMHGSMKALRLLKRWIEANMTGKSIADAHRGSYEAYFGLVKADCRSRWAHSDHFSTNRAYGTSAYSMVRFTWTRSGTSSEKKTLQRHAPLLQHMEDASPGTEWFSARWRKLPVCNLSGL